LSQVKGHSCSTFALWHLFFHFVVHLECLSLHSPGGAGVVGVPPLHLPHVKGHCFWILCRWHRFFHLVVHFELRSLHSADVVEGACVGTCVGACVGAVVSGGVDAPSTYKSLFGDPAGSVTASFVALESRRFATASGVRFGSPCNSNAAAPATWGHAIDVPCIRALALSLLCPAEMMLTPGAKMSRQRP